MRLAGLRVSAWPRLRRESFRGTSQGRAAGSARALQLSQTRQSSAFDWTGEKDYEELKASPEVPWNAEEASLLVGRKEEGTQRLLAMTLRPAHGEPVDVVPLWVGIRQAAAGQIASIYKALTALSDDILPATIASAEAVAFGSASGLRLLTPDVQHGAWHNYLVGVEGQIAANQLDTVWPNRIFHGERVAYNLMEGADVARFLAHPERQRVLDHLGNLQGLQQERGYRPGWPYIRLCRQYGRAAVDSFGLNSRNCDLGSQQNVLAAGGTVASVGPNRTGTAQQESRDAWRSGGAAAVRPAQEGAVGLQAFRKPSGNG